MFRFIVLFILLAQFVALQTFAQEKTTKKIALIIAVGTYEPSTQWRSISSINDIPFIKTALISQGFSETNIDTLKNEKATKEGIVKALDNLIAKSAAGDIVVFHFSGHGQQIFDSRERKDELDGYDEALVPYNAGMRYDPVTNKGQNHLRDEELGDKLKILRGKIGSGGSLLVLIDACHSGTATRGEDVAVTRGTVEKFEPADYASTIKTAQTNSEGIFDDKGLLSNMVVISAASADQLNYETKDEHQQGVGSLTYAFSKAISQINGEINYKILFEKIKNDIQGWKPIQTPQIEGNTEQQVFGGKFIKSGELIQIDKWINDKTIAIPRGAIHSIATGAKFRLFPVDVLDYNKIPAAATGEITAVSMAKSTGTLSEPVKDKNTVYKVIFDSKSFGDMNVAVKIQLKEAAIANGIRNKLKEYSYITLDAPNSDILIEPYRDPKSAQQLLQVIAVNDSVLWQKTWPGGSKNVLTETESDEILKAIKKFSRAQFLRSIHTPADDKSFERVKVEIVPGIVKTINEQDSMVKQLTLADKTNVKGDLEFFEKDESAEENDGFIIRVKNNYDYSVFISVLDIQPDNIINVTIPDPNDPYSTAQDYKIMPGRTLETRPITLYRPYGKEFMKLLITKEPMDLKSVQTRSATKGAGSSFENFYNDTFKDDDSKESRGPKVAPVKVDEIRIVPITFNIVAKKK